MTVRASINNNNLSERFARLTHVDAPVVRQALLDPQHNTALTLNDLARTQPNGQFHTVLDYGAGRGEWMRKVQASNPAWLAPKARICGLEIECAESRAPLSEINQQWAGLEMFLSAHDPDFPQPGTVDMVHAAFFHLEINDSLERYLNHVDQLLVGGGWFVSAAARSIYDMSLPILSILSDMNYDIFLVNGIFSDALGDYPRVTTWWHIVMQDSVRHLPYFYVAQKPQAKTP